MRGLPWVVLCLLWTSILLGPCEEARAGAKGKMSHAQPRRGRQIEADEIAPVIDSVDCPPASPAETTFVWCFVIHAHDEAGFAPVATQPEALEYSHTFTPPPPAPPISPAVEWSTFNRTLEVFLDGHAYQGEYTFACWARDLAGNTSPEWVCRSTIGH